MLRAVVIGQGRERLDRQMGYAVRLHDCRVHKGICSQGKKGRGLLRVRLARGVLHFILDVYKTGRRNWLELLYLGIRRHIKSWCAERDDDSGDEQRGKLGPDEPSFVRVGGMAPVYCERPDVAVRKAAKCNEQDRGEMSAYMPRPSTTVRDRDRYEREYERIRLKHPIVNAQ